MFDGNAPGKTRASPPPAALLSLTISTEIFMPAAKNSEAEKVQFANRVNHAFHHRL
jgi:hypothetical protein